MTTIGKLNFFRWALETKILDYIEAHQEDIRTGYNVYLKNTLQHQKKKEGEDASPVSSASSTPDAPMERPDHSSLRTTRRRTKQTPSSLNKLQVYTTPIVLDFD